MRIFSFIIFVIILMLGVVFATLNHTPVAFNYYFNVKEISLSLLLVFSVGVGMFFGFVFAFVSWLKLKTANYRLRSKLQNTEQEIEKLRAIPITGP